MYIAKTNNNLEVNNMVKKFVSKPVLSGIIMGIMLMSSVAIGAMSSNVEGWIYTKNPLFSNPKGYAYTMGFQTITAKISASKGGTTNSQTVSEYNKYGGSVETDWISGPTYSSSGTVFRATHTGYNNKGVYEVLYGMITY